MNRELENPDIRNNAEYAQTLGRERSSLEKNVGGIINGIANPSRRTQLLTIG